MQAVMQAARRPPMPAPMQAIMQEALPRLPGSCASTGPSLLPSRPMDPGGRPPPPASMRACPPSPPRTITLQFPLMPRYDAACSDAIAPSKWHAPPCCMSLTANMGTCLSSARIWLAGFS